MKKRYNLQWEYISGDMTLFVREVIDGFLEQMPQVGTGRTNRSRSGDKVGRENCREQHMQKAWVTKELGQHKTWRATSDRDYAKNDNEVHLEKWAGARCVWHDWDTCCELRVLFWVTIGGLQGREWHGQMYSLKQSRGLRSGVFINTHHAPGTVPGRRDTTVRIVPPWWTSQPTGKTKH